MNQKRVILIVVLVLFVVFGYFSIHNYLTIKPIYDEVEKKFNIAKNVQDIANWKTYSNDNYTLKYPNLDFELNNVGDSVYIYPTSQFLDFGPMLNISSSVDARIDGFINKYKTLLSRDFVNVNGIRWTRIVWLDISGTGPGYVYVTFFAKKDGLEYMVWYTEKDASGKDFADKIFFEQIFSTFKFTQFVDSIVGKICGGHGPFPYSCPTGYYCKVLNTGAFDIPGSCVKN